MRISLKYFSCFLILAFSFNLFSQPVFDVYESVLVKNLNVKKKTHWINGSLAKSGFKGLEVTYNSSGDILEEVTYRSSGTVAIKKNYKYDGQGNIIEYQTYDGKRDKITFKKFVKYSADNQKVIEKGFDGVDRFENRYKYDASGKLIEIRYYMSDKMIERREVKYIGNKKEIFIKNSNGENIGRHVNNYDAKGNLLETIIYSSSGSENNKTVYTYNTNGLKATEATYFSGNFKEKKYYEYKGKEPVRIYKEPKESSKFLEREYEYDNQGRLYKEKWTDKPNGKYSTKTYIYNDMGLATEIKSYFAAYNFTEDVKINYNF